jgi:hypothetical protein
MERQTSGDQEVLVERTASLDPLGSDWLTVRRKRTRRELQDMRLVD